MNGYLPGMESEYRDLSKSQWYTDPKLAARVWAWANRYEQATTVLEPAAGHGALIKPIFDEPGACRAVTAIDIDARNVDVLRSLSHRHRDAVGYSVTHSDFFAYSDPTFFDLGLENPAYEEGKAERFVLHTLTMCRRVVGIFKASIKHGVDRYHTLWKHAVVTREVELMARPSFGTGESGATGGKSDFVVLEIRRARASEPEEQSVLVEKWII